MLKRPLNTVLVFCTIAAMSLSFDSIAASKSNTLSFQGTVVEPSCHSDKTSDISCYSQNRHQFTPQAIQIKAVSSMMSVGDRYIIMTDSEDINYFSFYKVEKNKVLLTLNYN